MSRCDVLSKLHRKIHTRTHRCASRSPVLWRNIFDCLLFLIIYDRYLVLLCVFHWFIFPCYKIYCIIYGKFLQCEKLWTTFYEQNDNLCSLFPMLCFIELDLDIGIDKSTENNSFLRFDVQIPIELHRVSSAIQLNVRHCIQAINFSCENSLFWFAFDYATFQSQRIKMWTEV